MISKTRKKNFLLYFKNLNQKLIYVCYCFIMVTISLGREFSMKKMLDVIVPVYNEEACITETIQRLFNLRNILIDELDVNFIFVNDGSKDKSLEILKSFASRYPFIKVIGFSRNFGHQMAVTAGLDYSKGDYVAIIDADLQDPPELIKDMYEKSKDGYQVVYGKRLKRKAETLFKKFTAFAFYRLLDFMCQINIPTDTGDFRLITREVADAVKSMPEKHRFIRGMVPWVGFNSAPLYYNRDERFAGETKYPLSKMLKLAFDGIFSFSVKPLKFITDAGIALMIMAVAAFVSGIVFKCNISIISSVVLFVGSLQMIALGIIGEYIGRIFEEAKDRPLYIVKDKINL